VKETINRKQNHYDLPSGVFASPESELSQERDPLSTAPAKLILCYFKGRSQAAFSFSLHTPNMSDLLNPATIDEAVHAVSSHARVQVLGAGTKPALVQPVGGAVRISSAKLQRVIDYHSSEFLITALAGTTLAELEQVLASENQYLPFDPPRMHSGATIGGTVAAGLSGPGRLRFGGLRDFIMQVQLIDGLGKLVTGGCQVVKNAAGYDLPKLVVGSCGGYGMIVAVTLKVFPRPVMRRTVACDTGDIAKSLRIVAEVVRSGLEIDALDVEASGRVLLRWSGREDAIESAQGRLASMIPNDWQPVEDSVWEPFQEWLHIGANSRLVRVPIAPSQVVAMDHSLNEQHAGRRYSVAGNVAWIEWLEEKPIRALDDLLRHHQLGGTILTGHPVRCRVGRRPSLEMETRIKRALDPSHRFVRVE
jgi:glycolate oxidase FAD binding subunit